MSDFGSQTGADGLTGGLDSGQQLVEQRHGGHWRQRGALVTNCGIERERVSGLHRHPADGRAWLHISAGLGTSPWAPARFACRPEASLLTLLPRDAG